MKNFSVGQIFDGRDQIYKVVFVAEDHIILRNVIQTAKKICVFDTENYNWLHPMTKSRLEVLIDRKKTDIEKQEWTLMEARSVLDELLEAVQVVDAQ